jgi:hypothetical protein|tara:strand:+ start:128 stop:400 length:273 start_codon:yes stop_codon:yes gene_type:complete
MTDRQIEQMAIRVADIVIQALEGKQQEWDKALVADLQEFKSPIEDEEQILLGELAKLMTLLDSYLKSEDYTQCAIIQKQILKVENKLNQI